jgi:hypothetical protein
MCSISVGPSFFTSKLIESGEFHAPAGLTLENSPSVHIG